jgi:hypothetical protein
VTGAHLLVTEIRLQLAKSNTEAAAQLLEQLRHESTAAPLRGERHAAAVLGAETALAAGRFEEALGMAMSAWGAEPLRGTNRWFGSLEVADLLLRSEHAAGNPPSLRPTFLQHLLADRLGQVPAQFRTSFMARPEVRRLERTTRELEE